MRLETKKFVSKYLRAFVFLLILFKGGFSLKAASAQSCLASPACAALLAAEEGSAVAAPTGTGVSASTLTTTTANGTVTAVVRASAGVVVVGTTAAGYSVWHYWGQAQNEQAQNKARRKYCSAYPQDSVCGLFSTSWSNVNSTYQIAVPPEVTSYSVISSSFIRTGWSAPHALDGSNSVAINDWDIPGRT